MKNKSSKTKLETLRAYVRSAVADLIVTAQSDTIDAQTVCAELAKSLRKGLRASK